MTSWMLLNLFFGISMGQAGPCLPDAKATKLVCEVKIPANSGIESVRFVFSPKAKSFRTINLVIHGCGPYSGWSKLDFGRFHVRDDETLYVFPMNSAHESCAMGHLRFFKKNTVANSLAAWAKSLAGALPNIHPNPTYHLAAHSGAFKVVPTLAAYQPALFQGYYLIDATYLNGFFTSPPGIEAAFRTFAKANGSKLHCFYSTLKTGLRTDQTPMAGCQELCPTEKGSQPKCAANQGYAIDHMGLFYSVLGQFF